MIREALASMCYREIQSKVWAKSIGFHMFVIENDTRPIWIHYFMNSNGQMVVWERKELYYLKNEEFLYNLKMLESHSNINYGSPLSQFELSWKTN
jgi:hypothetical protein